jgi:hypothetical protein
VAKDFDKAAVARGFLGCDDQPVCRLFLLAHAGETDADQKVTSSW